MYEFSEFKFLHHLDRLQAICRGELLPPVTFEVDLTNACNHRCIWCLDHSSNSQTNSTLKEDSLLHFADEIAKQGVRSIVFKGSGEPLLYYSFSKVVQHLQSKGLELGLITNGETIDRHLKAIPHLSWLFVSLDAGTAKTHQKLHKPFKINIFDSIVDNLYQISTSVFTGVDYKIHPDNIQEIETATHLARDVGCRCITFKHMISEDNQTINPKMVREFDKLMIKLKHELESTDFQILNIGLPCFSQGNIPLPYNNCLAHHLIGILGSDGHLYPCMALRGEVDYSYGCIYRDTFQDIWYGKKRKAVLKKITQKECLARCLDQNSHFRYYRYNHLLEYLTTAKEKVGHIDFL